MKKFAIGFLLIFLDFNLNFNQASLNVLPDFVGYYLLLQGTREMEGESSLFAGPRPFMVVMIVYTAILWVGGLFGISGGLLMTLLNVIALAVSFYISWVLVQALRDMETRHNADLYGTVLNKRWKILLGINAAIQLLRLLATVATIRVVLTLATVLVLAGLIWSFLFVLGWNRAANLWAELQAAPAGTAEHEPPAGEPSETDAEDEAGGTSAAPEEPAEAEE